MSSTKKRRNKEDTWRQEDLEKSIKNALADSNEKPRSKHRNKEDRVKDTADTDIIKKDKRSKERHSQRSRERNSENVDYDKSRSLRSKEKEEDKHEKREDRHERREDRRERREDKRDRREDKRERREDKRERRDDRHEKGEDKLERREDRRERREDKHEKHEDKRERREDKSERRNDRHERSEDKHERREDRRERREDKRERREDKERRHSRNGDSNKIDPGDEKGSGVMIEDEDQRRKSRRHKSHKESKHRDQDRDRDEDKDRDRHKDRDNDEKRRQSSRHSESKPEDPSDQDYSSNHQRPKKNSRDELQEESHATTPEDNDAYEDDFEDYEDDFEDTGQGDSDENDMDSSEMAALRRAMEKENEATSRKSRERDSSSSKPAASSRSDKKQARQTFINFTAAKQRQINTKVAQRTKQRGRRLMNLIELDVSSYSVFEMPPVKVYELYIKSYGRSNTKQAFAQCNDDTFDRDIQTEPIETRDVLIQHPCDGTPIVYDNSTTKGNTAVKLNSLRLSAFLEKASQVMNTILEDNISDYYKRRGLQSNQRNILFSQGYTKISCDLSFLKGRHVTHAQFHSVQTNLLLTVYSRPKVHDGKNLSCQDILCVWNVHSPSHPHRILTCKSEVTCCCFSPVKSTFAFAGTADGGILVWDLREPSSMHTSINDDEGGKWSLQVPTFSTCGVHYEENHHNVVTKLLPVITSQDSYAPSIPNAEQAKKTDETHGLSFQLASLDQQGLIHFWVVIDMDQTDNAGSETDLGLVPNGKVKLLKSSSIILENPSRNMLQDIQAKDMKFSLKHPNEFYVATDLGFILHGSRHGDRVSPRCYRRHGDVPVAVIQLDFSPFGLPCFLAASCDGCIYLYSLALDSPLLTWSNSTSDMPIVSLSWSRSRPSVFYVVDVTSKVYVWELLVNQGGPVKTEQFTNGRVITMELSNDHSVTGRGTQGRTASMVITDDKGSVEVHTLNQQFSVASDNELQLMTEFLNAFK